MYARVGRLSLSRRPARQLTPCFSRLPDRSRMVEVPVKIRKLLAAAALTAGLAAPTVAFAADNAPEFAFSTLKPMATADAKAKAAAWLKSINKFDETAFNKIWADETRPLTDRVADSLALGNSEAEAILKNVRDGDKAAPVAVPAL